MHNPVKWIVALGFGMMCRVGLAMAADEVVYEPHGKRDPFIPLVATTDRGGPGLGGIEQFDEIRLEGVVYDARAGSVVVLNGAVLKEGDSLGNAKVVKIQRDGVLVSLNGVEAFQPLYREEKKAENVQKE